VGAQVGGNCTGVVWITWQCQTTTQLFTYLFSFKIYTTIIYQKMPTILSVI
jgi:hypothetical protein